ncbi:hypothetical protein KCH_09490 [Kitasatospora cheerisanensis KCTC 2395]|uniref:Uncharacterized protein n=1 Tax=Kitasatospora cheerisanensis KCTC 2395 TaxID=1348663 RepID=A0A066Z1F0_9ACTN|nr:hypothetical protein KCH_09490 [Kitasatospora cheerisanensis KCTC 2395]
MRAEAAVAHGGVERGEERVQAEAQLLLRGVDGLPGERLPQVLAAGGGGPDAGQQRFVVVHPGILSTPVSPVHRFARTSVSFSRRTAGAPAGCLRVMVNAHKSAVFRSLHTPARPLALANAWDVASARVVEAAGAPAIATTSAGTAWALGAPDGDRVPRDLVLEAVARIAAAVDVPVTADIEGGYGQRPAEVADTVSRVVDAGAVGINIEDGTRAPAAFAEHLAAAREAARKAGVDLFINARVDTYLRGLGDPATRLRDTLGRARSYIAAGADGIFAPGVSDPTLIGELATALPVPLNIMAGPAPPRSPPSEPWASPASASALPWPRPRTPRPEARPSACTAPATTRRSATASTTRSSTACSAAPVDPTGEQRPQQGRESAPATAGRRACSARPGPRRGRSGRRHRHESEVSSIDGAELPLEFAVVPVVGAGEPGGGGDGRGGGVVGVDVGGDGVGPLVAEPGDEGAGRFRGDASALPGGADHPGDLGGGAALVGGDGGLDGAGQAGGVGVGACVGVGVVELDHPVAPGLGGVERAGRPALVAGAESLGGIRGTADEVVQRGIRQDGGHLLGVLDPQGQQGQSVGADDGGLHAVLSWAGRTTGVHATSGSVPSAPAERSASPRSPVRMRGCRRHHHRSGPGRRWNRPSTWPSSSTVAAR